jgi:hypothetical protein
MILIMTLLFAGQALAGDCDYRTVRIDGQLIAVGDSPREAHQLGPDREVQLENRYGGAAGYRLDFYERGKTVEIHINRGEVRLICQRRG